jgi:hypothetical protein
MAIKIISDVGQKRCHRRRWLLLELNWANCICYDFFSLVQRVCICQFFFIMIQAMSQIMVNIYIFFLSLSLESGVDTDLNNYSLCQRIGTTTMKETS